MPYEAARGPPRSQPNTRPAPTRRRPWPSAPWSGTPASPARHCRSTRRPPGGCRPTPMSSTTTTRRCASRRRSSFPRGDTPLSFSTCSTCRTRFPPGTLNADQEALVASIRAAWVNFGIGPHGQDFVAVRMTAEARRWLPSPRHAAASCPMSAQQVISRCCRHVFDSPAVLLEVGSGMTSWLR